MAIDFDDGRSAARAEWSLDDDTEPTLTVLVADAEKAVRRLRAIADHPEDNHSAFGPFGELNDIIDLLTPGSWGADGTPYETVSRRISAVTAAEQRS